MAEFTSKVVMGISPIGQGAGAASLYKTVLFIQGVCATNSDTITVTGLTTVNGAFLIATDGTVGAMTFATNVITVTNGSTKTWSGLCWGV